MNLQSSRPLGRKTPRSRTVDAEVLSFQGFKVSGHKEQTLDVAIAPGPSAPRPTQKGGRQLELITLRAAKVFTPKSQNGR